MESPSRIASHPLITTAEARTLLAMSRSAFSRAVVAGKITPALSVGTGRNAANLFARRDIEALAAGRVAS